LEPQDRGDLVVRGNNNRITLGNVVVGDVWVVGTRPNANIPPAKKLDSHGFRFLDYNRIRFLSSPAYNRQMESQNTAIPSWQIFRPDPDELAGISSVPFYFGLEAANDAPGLYVGVIETGADVLRGLPSQADDEIKKNRELNLVRESMYRAERRAYAEYHHAQQQWEERRDKAQPKGELFLEPQPQKACYPGLYSGSANRDPSSDFFTVRGAFWCPSDGQ
jgi:hypothetical protein